MSKIEDTSPRPPSAIPLRRARSEGMTLTTRVLVGDLRLCLGRLAGSKAVGGWELWVEDADYDPDTVPFVTHEHGIRHARGKAYHEQLKSERSKAQEADRRRRLDRCQPDTTGAEAP